MHPREHQAVKAKKLINEINKAVSLMIYTLRDVYERFDINFQVKDQYLHAMVMSIVSPTEIQNLPDINNHPYVVSRGANPLTKRLERHEIVTYPQVFIQKLEDRVQAKLLNLIIQQESQQQAQNPQKGKQKAHRKTEQHSRVSKALNRQQERYLSDWIVGEISMGKHIDMMKVQEKAIQIAKPKTIVASQFWFQSFLYRNPIAKRAMSRSFKPQGNSGSSSSDQSKK